MADRGQRLLLGAVLAGCILVDAVVAAQNLARFDHVEIGTLAYLCVLSVPLSAPLVRLPRGFLSLGAIATNSAALSLSPLLALVVGITEGLAHPLFHRRIMAVPIVQVTTLATAALVAAQARIAVAHVAPDWLAVSVSLVTINATNVALTAVVGAIIGGESLVSIVRRNLNRHWVGAFLYFGAAAVLISQLLNGATRGYVLASLVAVLALALSDSVAGRETRNRLEAELATADRYIAHSRIVEGTIHNIKNHLAAALGHLEELPVTRFQQDVGQHSAVARNAVADAVESLNQLQAGTTSEEGIQPALLDLSSLAEEACSLMQSRATPKRVQLRAVLQPALKVRADPLLLKQAIANLLLNAIEAVATDGEVSVVASRSGRWASVSVQDNGPGVPARFRPRLFEPHFTTKPNGHGLGLYTSYGIARRHGGDLRYEGDKQGATFSLRLPLAD